MKIKTTLTAGEYDADTRISVELTTDDTNAHLSIGEGEPEDMTLFRDLSDVYQIPDMLRAAYEAGKRGEPISEEEETEHGEDF